MVIPALAACQTLENEASRRTPVGATFGPSNEAGAPTTEADQDPMPGQWDPGAWEPTVSVVAPTFSEEERLMWLEQRLDMYADDLDGPPPEVATVRWTESLADYGTAIEQCLAEQGFTVEHDGRGGFNMAIPPQQEKAYYTARYVCNAMYPINPVFAQEWSPEQLGLLYDYWDQYFIPCLAAHDVLVNTTNKPSREVYISKFHTPDRTDWWPSDYLAMLPSGDRARIEPVCPPQPPPEVFYGTSSSG